VCIVTDKREQGAARAEPPNREENMLVGTRNTLMRQEIMNAALQLFGQNSVSNVTLAQVAQELELTKSAIYHYFDTKEDLLRSIFSGWATACREKLEIVMASPLGPEEMLQQLFRTHVRYITSDFALYVLSVRTEAELPESVRLEVRHMKHDTDTYIQEVISRGQREGVFKPMDERLAEFAGIGMFNWMWRWYHPGRDDPDTIAELFSRIFIDGIRMRKPNGDDPRSASPSGLSTFTAEYHASEIRHHTEMLERLVERTQSASEQKKAQESRQLAPSTPTG
jgi:AcrR family transcriptional regulator